MSRISKLPQFAAGIGLLTLTACGTSGFTNGPEAIFDPAVRYPVTVEPRMVSLRLPYEGPASLDRSASAQLARLAGEYMDHGSGVLAISAPLRYPRAPSEIASRLMELGVPEDRIMTGNRDEPGAEGTVKLTYIRYTAETPSCGDWSVNLARTNDNTAPPNFGCATRKNIAAMVADPRDLVSPQTSEPTDAARRLTVLDKYRRGEPTLAQKAEAQSGVVTSVAQGK